MQDAVHRPRVVARANPFTWALLIAVLIYSLANDVQTLQASGWLNPEAFFNENTTFGRNNPYNTIPWFGHAMMVIIAIAFTVLFTQFSILAAARFNALTFDGRYLREHGLPRRTPIEPTAITTAKRIPPSFGSADWIEIRYRKSDGREGGMVIMPWFKWESVDVIAANLAACGIPVAPRGDDR